MRDVIYIALWLLVLLALFCIATGMLGAAIKFWIDLF